MESNQIQLKNINRRSVLNYIRKNQTATKAGVAAATGLTFAAIKKILDELEAMKLVRFSRIEKNSVGRNSVMYEINADYGCIISIYVNRKAIHVAVVNLGGNIVSKQKLPMENRELTQQELIENILRSVREVIRESGIAEDKFIGVGIGVPGPIDLERGLILTPPNMPVLRYLPMRQIMEAKLGLPVYLHKDTNVLALGEYWHGAHRSESNLVYLDVDMGLGSGLILDGKIHVGAEGKAGEYGHVTIDPSGPLCKCGNHGCLEAMGSGIAILRDFREQLDSMPEHPLYEKRSNLEIDDVIQAVRNNDMTAITIVNKAAYNVGIGVANLINFLDPEVVVLGGLCIRNFPGSFDIISNVAREKMMKNNVVNNISRSELGMDAGVVGCAEVVIDNFFQNEVNELWAKNQE